MLPSDFVTGILTTSPRLKNDLSESHIQDMKTHWDKIKATHILVYTFGIFLVGLSISLDLHHYRRIYIHSVDYILDTLTGTFLVMVTLGRITVDCSLRSILSQAS
jgi:hypothetical protein